jgi:GH25 family lysozyme M1 (1,4-beta-N-acetylmuramidase)
MKKRVLLITGCLLLIILVAFSSYKIYSYIRIKNAKIEVVLVDDLTLEFTDSKKVSDYIKSINGKIVDDYIIDSTKLGEKEVNFKFINDDNIKLDYSYKINVIDTVAPVVWLSSSYSIAKGSEDNLTEKILCGDNYDSNPDCVINGDYDLNTTGTYPLTFTATDSSGNVTQKEFNLRVYEPSNSNYTQTKTYTYFSDVVKNYKNEDTKIGIDVSGWQGDIDFEKIKNAGVEFIIIKVGGTKGTNLDYYVDSKFIQNIENANKYGIDVGLYFYSYASSSKEAIKDAKWLLKQIKDYDVTLPIAFDWEDFKDFNSYNLSFFGLTSMAEDFLKTIEDAGYKGMLYGSKNYLEQLWMTTKYDVWLAHYTDKTNYEGNYKFWQICDDGVIDGINGYVDIDIMYN